jgi:hypothetical protein
MSEEEKGSTSQTETGTSTGRTKVDWYKWAAGIAVPLAVAVIGLFKLSGGGGEKQTPNNFTLVTDVTVIENQYQQIAGQPLKDENVKQLIRAAINLAKAGQNEESRKLFQQLASSVPVPAVYNNLGALDAESGNLEGAHQAYQMALAKDPDYKPAQQNQQKLVRFEAPRITGVRDQESEPNNDFNHTNLISIGRKIAGDISDGSDTDFYQFKTPQGPRDIYQATIENRSALRPGLNVYDANRHQLNAWNQCWSDEPVAQLDCQFTALPESTYYVQAYGRSGSTGAYALVVTPLKRYDSYEPNDDFLQAKPISIASRIEANIMDGSDTDFYIVKTGSAGAQLTARIENDSLTLRPGLNVYDANRHQLNAWNQCWSDEPVAQVECPFTAAPQSAYFVQVYGRSSSAGAYKLTVK